MSGDNLYNHNGIRLHRNNRYDNMNRLTTSTYGEGTAYTSNKNYFNENISEYDYNGNIKPLWHSFA